MKIAHMLAALGLAAAILPVGASASAQPYSGSRWNDGRHYDRGRNHYNRHWNNGRHYAYGYGRNHYSPRCWTEWRHHHRIRVCR